LSSQILAQGFHLPQAFCPPFLNRRFGTSDRQRPRWDIFGYNSAGANISPIPDPDWRDERGIRTDEGPFANIGAMFGDAVIVASDGTCANICTLAHTRITDICEMIGFGTSFDVGLFYLDEIPYVHVLAEFGAGTQPREGADARAHADMCAFKV